MFKKMLLRQLNRRLEEAMEIGLMEAGEANALREGTAAWDWVAILQLVLLIGKLIMDFINSQNERQPA